jgi:hypothetical protein
MAAKAHSKKPKSSLRPSGPARPVGPIANPLRQGPQRWQRFVRYNWDKKKG